MTAETKQELFNYLSGELGAIALESNLFDIEKIIKNKQPIAEMAKQRLEKERGGNISLWVDDEQTEYWTEIYSMGVEDERYERLSEN